MGIADRLWAALTIVVKLDDKVTRQAEILTGQQARIEDLAGRVIRLEAQIEMMLRAATRRLPGN